LYNIHIQTNTNFLKMDIEQLVAGAVSQGASDIHLSSGVVPHFRVSGVITPQGEEAITAEFLQEYLMQILPEKQKQQLQENRQTDFVMKSAAGVRLRGNAFFQENGISVVLRIIAQEIRQLDTLGFPEFVIEKIKSLRNGFVLIVGATGEGKSTTLASVLQHIVNETSQHVITIEDPIEYLLPRGKSVIQQREVGRDVTSFRSGIRAALREDPDILMVGEMRDYETISAALTMAETGHTVFSTLHTSDCPQTISRIIDVFPPEQQEQVRSQLATALKVIIAQRLVPTVDGKVALAYEVLTNNYAIQNYIRQNKIFQIPSALQTDSSGEMVQLEQSLAGLVISQQVSPEVAKEYASDPEQLRAILAANGIK
jgi:twitching motility protein PilT